MIWTATATNNDNKNASLTCIKNSSISVSWEVGGPGWSLHPVSARAAAGCDHQVVYNFYLLA